MYVCMCIYICVEQLGGGGEFRRRNAAKTCRLELSPPKVDFFLRGVRYIHGMSWWTRPDRVRVRVNPNPPGGGICRVELGICRYGYMFVCMYVYIYIDISV